MILSKRLEKIISLVDKNCSVIDIGTDHALVPIELYKRSITTDVWGTDISPNVCKNTINNLKKIKLDNIIKIKLSDGFDKISRDFDIAILAGMGTTTILRILDKCDNLPMQLIISSHNDYDILRIKLNKMGYMIICEDVIYDKGKFYPIIKYEKGYEKLTKEELYFGKSKNEEYYKFLYYKYKNLYELSHNEIYEEFVSLLFKLLKKC